MDWLASQVDTLAKQASVRLSSFDWCHLPPH